MPKTTVREHTRQGKKVRSHKRSLPSAQPADVNVTPATDKAASTDPFLSPERYILPEERHTPGDPTPKVGPFINTRENSYRHIMEHAGISTERQHVGQTERCDVYYQQQSDQENTLHSMTRGYLVPQYTFHDKQTGEKVGTIKLQTTTDELVEHSIPTVVEYADSEGKIYLDSHDSAQSAWRKLFGTEYGNRPHERPASNPHATAKQILDGEIQIDEQTAADDITKHFESKGLEQERQRFIGWLKNYPFTDFSSVEEGYRRQGYGKEMYVAVTQHLGQQGKRLHASGTLSESAEKLWVRLEQDPDVPVIDIETIEPSGKKRIKKAISYVKQDMSET